MVIDFKSALVYPFRERNLKDTLAFPGLLLFVTFVIELVIAFILEVMFPSERASLSNHGAATSNLLQSIVSFPITFILSSFLYGFRWHLVAQLQREGIDAEPPSWTEHWHTFFIDGVKLYGFYFLFGTILLLLGLIPIGVIVAVILSLSLDSLIKAILFTLIGLFCCVGFILCFPYYAAFPFHCAQTRKFGELWNLKNAFHLAKSHYVDVLYAMVLSILSGILYLFASIILVITCVGLLLLPFLQVAMGFTCLHLFTQAFGLQDSSSEPKISVITE